MNEWSESHAKLNVIELVNRSGPCPRVVMIVPMMRDARDACGQPSRGAVLVVNMSMGIPGFARARGSFSLDALDALTRDTAVVARLVEERFGLCLAEAHELASAIVDALKERVSWGDLVT